MVQHWIQATPRSVARRTENKHSSKYVFTAALFTIAKRWKQSKCPSGEGCINKMHYGNTVEYYSAIKRNEVAVHAATWMNFGNMPPERREAQMITQHTVPFT